MTHDLSPALHPPVVRPSARFMLSHPAHAIALGFGAGLSPVAPGTVGTLWAWVSYSFLDQWLAVGELGVLIAMAAAVGWWACTVTATRMRVQDPGAIVWDEVVAFWLVLWLLQPAGLVTQALAFAWFRLFDAVKPGPVAWADHVFKGSGWRGGFGILFDDLVAAFCVLLLFAWWRF